MPVKKAVLIAGFLALNCSSIEIKNKYDRCEKITIGPGTEDFALLGNTIYVSSHERRGWKVAGDIFAFDLKSRKVKKMVRTGEPTNLFFAPHGIDTFKNGGDTLLYVVNHGAEMNDNDHSILIYTIKDGNLEYLTQIRDELLNSPNDVSVTETGGFYVTNDHGSRGSLWEVFWGLKRSKVLYCTMTAFTPNAGAICRVATEGLAMANGVLAQSNKVYISATREGKVYEFARNTDGTLGAKTLIGEVPGPDNLFLDGAKVMTASHTSNWGFFRHSRSAENKAPSYVVAIEPGSPNVTGLYYSDGTEISAASGAFIYNGKLYISQVFEDFILECKVAP